jgi:hypothetical protein
MMGRLKSDQGQLFYEFHLGDAVPKIISYGRSMLPYWARNVRNGTS